MELRRLGYDVLSSYDAAQFPNYKFDVKNQGFLFAISGVGETRKNIVVGEVGEVYKDFFGSHAGGKVGEDIINGDTHTSDAGFAAALARFESDDVLVVHSGCCDRDRP